MKKQFAFLYARRNIVSWGNSEISSIIMSMPPQSEIIHASTYGRNIFLWYASGIASQTLSAEAKSQAIRFLP